MIDLKDFSLFEECKNTLKEVSKNDADKKNIIYMVERQDEVIDFDEVKEKYIKELSLENTPTSNDCLMMIKGKIYFIEFKDGDLKKQQYDIRKKIFESILIFCDIVKENISFTRNNLNYILVYNEIKNGKLLKEYQKNNEKEKNKIQYSSNFDKIVKFTNQLAKSNVDFLELRKNFSGMYLKDVFTYNEEEFIKFLDN